MLNEQTVTKMNELKLFGMARGFADRIGRADHAELSHADFVGLLVEDEKLHRENQRLARLLQNAKLNAQACLEDVNYKHPRSLDKQTILELIRGDWLEKKLNILLTGPTGIGKSFIARALGHQACRAGHTTAYWRFPKLAESLFVAKADGTHLKMLARLARTQVLILDDFGLSPLTDPERKDMLEMVEDRYEIGPIVVTSQLPIKDWHQIVGDPTLADAILDRIFHRAHKIEMKGKSLR